MSATTNTPPTLKELRQRREEILALAGQYGASNVRVVGSVARQEAQPHDVDLLISVSRPRSVFELVGLWLDMQALLGCDVSLIPDNIDDERFLQSVMEDAVPL